MAPWSFTLGPRGHVLVSWGLQELLLTRFPLRIPGVGHGQGSVDEVCKLRKWQISKEAEYENKMGKIHRIRQVGYVDQSYQL